MAQFSEVLYEKEGPIATITLNRPARRNDARYWFMLPSGGSMTTVDPFMM